MPFGIDASGGGTSSNGNGAGWKTWSHTNAGNLLIVRVAMTGNAGRSVSGITYNGVALTLLDTAQQVNNPRVEVWYLKNPSVGTFTVSLSTAGPPTTAIAGSISFNLAEIVGTTFGTVAKDFSLDFDPTVVATSATGEIVIDIVCFTAGTGTTNTVGVGQTQQFNAVNTVDGLGGGGSTEPGASSVTMSWGLNQSRDWTIIAVAVKPPALPYVSPANPLFFGD